MLEIMDCACEKMNIRPTRMLVAIFFVAGLCASTTPAQTFSGGELLKKVAGTYREALSFNIVADKTVELGVAGEGQFANGARIYSNSQQSVTAQVTLSASDATNGKLMLKEEKSEIAVVSDGKTVWTFVPAQQAYTEAPAGIAKEQRAKGRPDKSGADLLTDYRILLVDRYESLSAYESAVRLERSESLKVGGEKKECYVLMVQTSKGSHELWVDKARYVIWKSVDTTPTPLEGMALQTRVAVTAKEITLNSDFGPSFFTFTPPERTRKVDTLKLPLKNVFPEISR
jgi:outer membrane lipoprotein-sorting protein